MKTLELVNGQYTFKHKGINIENPILSDCGRGAIDPAAYGFEVVWTGGNCSAHGQVFNLNGERVLMVLTDGNLNAIQPESELAEIGLYRAPNAENDWDLLPENLITFYEVTR